jgi:hypothetical protein
MRPIAPAARDRSGRLAAHLPHQFAVRVRSGTAIAFRGASRRWRARGVHRDPLVPEALLESAHAYLRENS